MDRLSRLEAFVRVVERGSFSEAARSLKVSQPLVSKAVADLERHLKTRLLHRTTRSVSPTDAGATYYERVKDLMARLDEADREAITVQNRLQGLLRINTSAMLATPLVMPAVLEFGKVHGDVEFEVTMDDRRINLIEQGSDLAVRIGRLSDSTLRARKAGLAAMGFYASPSYLAEHPVADGPAPPPDGPFRFIRYRDQRAGEFGPLAGLSRLGVSNALLAKEAALAGAGLTILPRFLASAEVDAGRLIRILPDHPLPDFELSLIHPFSTAAPLRVSAFMDFAIEMWRARGLLRP